MEYGDISRPDEANVEFSYDMLRSLYSDLVIIGLEEYQREADARGLLLKEPVPNESGGEPTSHFEPLCWNKTIYDDATEAFMETDPIYQRLMHMRQQKHGNEYDLLRAMRSRRTILALVYEICGPIEAAKIIAQQKSDDVNSAS